MTDLNELSHHDLYLAYLDGVQRGDFEGDYKTFKWLVQTGRIETER